MVHKTHQSGTAHLTNFEIAIGNQTFNSSYQLHRHVLGLMVEYDDDYIPESYNKFLMEYLQLCGVIDIGQIEDPNLEQIWFKVPNLEVQPPYQISVFDLECFRVLERKLQLWANETSESEIQNPMMMIIEITPLLNNADRNISSKVLPIHDLRPLSFLK